MFHITKQALVTQSVEPWISTRREKSLQNYVPKAGRFKEITNSRDIDEGAAYKLSTKIGSKKKIHDKIIVESNTFDNDSPLLISFFFLVSTFDRDRNQGTVRRRPLSEQNGTLRLSVHLSNTTFCDNNRQLYRMNICSIHANGKPST
ncbi:hypothetical protein V1478_004240, partial [Vespula squamosa]